MRYLWLMVGAAAVLVLLAGSWSPAQSAADDASYVVDDPSDVADDTPGDTFCKTAGNHCTLRAAIMEANVQYAGHPGAVYTISLPGAPTNVLSIGAGVADSSDGICAASGNAAAKKTQRNTLAATSGRKHRTMVFLPIAGMLFR